MSGEPEVKTANRLSIQHLLVWSAGVAIAIAVLRLTKYLAIVADDAIDPSVRGILAPLQPQDLVVAAGYGTGLSLAYFAIVGGRGFWRDPGRILITLLATLGLFDLALTVIAYSYVIMAKTPMVAGVDYRSFAPTYGYALGVPFGLFVLIRSRTNWNWRIAWGSILAFSLWNATVMMLVYHTLTRTRPGQLAWFQLWIYSHWGLCFLIGTTVAIAGVTFAAAVDLIARRSMSWLTIAAVTVMVLMYAAVNAHFVLG